MAAFERVSKLIVKPHNVDEAIDIRRYRLPAVRPPIDDYDPRDHRVPQQPLNPWMAYFNMIRTLLGPGMLIMPLAISQGGIVLGPFLALMYGMILLHTHVMLLNCLNEVARQLKIPYVSYRYGFRLAVLHGPKFIHCIGQRGPQIIAIFMFLSQLGVCTIFVILTMDSVRDLMDWQSNDPALISLLPPYLFMLYYMKNIKVITYVGLVGTCLNLIGLVLVFYSSFNDPAKVFMYAATEFMPMLFACGAFLCNLSAVSVMLALDKGLKNPRLMTNNTGVLAVGMITGTVMCISVGTIGYWAFGTMEENVLRVLPLDEVVSLIILAVYLISVAFAYPINCHPAIAVIVEVVKYHDPINIPEPKTLQRIEKFGRPLFVMLTFVICYFVPFQAPFVALVGNLCSSMMSLVFPALMDVCLRYPDHYGYKDIHLVKNLFIMIIGLINWVFGAILCAYIIYVRILARASPNSHGYF